MVIKIDFLTIVLCLLLVSINNTPELLKLTDSITELIRAASVLTNDIKRG